MDWKSRYHDSLHPAGAFRASVRKKPPAFLAGFLIASALSGVAVAQESTPNTYADVSVPQLTGWNKVNALTVDGITGATPKTYIYTSAAAKDTAENLGNDETGGKWDADSPAQVYWELDNGSGRAPGIQTVTDDFDFPTKNCIMASGEMIDEKSGATIRCFSR